VHLTLYACTFCSWECCGAVNTTRIKKGDECDEMNRQQIQMNSNFFASLSPSIKIIISLSIFGYVLSFSDTAIQVSNQNWTDTQW
jgi:hypothetical protein